MGTAPTGGTNDSTADGFPADLLPRHAALVAASAIAPAVAAARGYRSLTTKASVRVLGFTETQQHVPALLLPVWNVHGEIASYQLRPDEPRINRDGKPIKYETPKASRMALDVPPAARHQLRNPEIALWITEGIRKADAAISHGLCCIALLGVWNWRGTNDDGGQTALADWEAIALKGRTVYLAFDSDVMTKPAVYKALRRLKGFLTGRGAAVNVVYLAPGAVGAKVGLDDYFAAGGTELGLLDLVRDDLSDPENDDDGQTTAGPYGIRDGRMCYRKRERDGDVWLELANFVARIVEEAITDDGVTEGAELVIAGKLANGTALPPARVPTQRFNSLDWVTAQWGARAVIAAGMGSRDRLREAIQRLSPDIPQRRVYTHVGWARLDGHGWTYLHAGGGIAASGKVTDVAVRLKAPADRLHLPDPPDGDALHEAVRLTLDALRVAPDRIMLPLLGAVWRAVLNAILPADTVVGLVGPTGVLKSELAALAQRAFGPDFDRTRLPGAWSATANFVERVAFDFKDALLIIDDFAPTGSPHDIQRYHANAEKVIRGAGNGAGRGRMAADGSLRPSYPPRALVGFTGEDIPRGQSVRARMVLLDVERGDVDKTALRAYQSGPGRGALALAMAGYLRWLAAHFDAISGELPARLAAVRADFDAADVHARTPEALANLDVGWWAFLRFARDAGAMADADAAALSRRVRDALTAVATEQAAHQTTEEPTRLYLALLRAALVSGKAHVAAPSGNAPTTAEAWGWRLFTVGTGEHERTEWRPQGDCIGWVAGADLYLEPRAAYTMAQRLGQAGGDALSVTLSTLNKRLHQAGLLATTERETRRQTFTVRKVFGLSDKDGKKTRCDVLHLAAAALVPREPDQPDQPDHGASEPASSRPNPPGNGRGSWSGNMTNDPEPDHATRPRPPKTGMPTWDASGPGRNGRVGRVSSPEDIPPAPNPAGHAAALERCYACGTMKPAAGVCRVCHPPV